MARFDVYRTEAGEQAPLYLDVQADIFSHLATRLVVPLLPADQARHADKLIPVFTIEGRPYAMMTTDMAAVPARVMGTRVTSLEEERYTITDAIDFLLQGF